MISDISIKRPVLTSMLALALVLFGAISFTRLSVRELPDVDPPVVSVSTFLRGANPRVMETTITDVLEEELSTIPGVRTISSSSSEQSSNITLEFTLDRDLEVAAQDVRDKVARVRGRLPEQIDEPVITKQDADAQPFFWLALTAANYDLLQLSDIADRVVKQRLQSVDGVGRAQVFGEKRYAMRVWLSPQAMASRGITVQDVQTAILTRNVEIPAGRIESQQREFSVRSLGELRTPEEFANIVVASDDRQVVRLGDVARVVLGPETERSYLQFDGTPGVAVGVIRQSKANLVEVSDNIQAEIPAIREALPPGVELTIGFDSSRFIRNSIREAQETLILAGVLVILIIFVFLRNVRATLVPALAIPTSIVAAFAVLYAFGFSINQFTLLALILAMGIVVDDAIIVMENAYRHQEELGEDPVTAAVNGTREIVFAVIATTISLVAVFTPLAFLQGTAGRLFNEFGVALAGAVVISSFIALTLTPMVSAKILRVPDSHGKVFLAFERALNGIATGYQRLLAIAVRHRLAVVGGAVLLVLSAGLVFRALPREFIPTEDRGFFIVFVQAPVGSSLEYTTEHQQRVEEIVMNTEGVEHYFSVIGFFGDVNTGIMFARLEDERDQGIEEIVGQIRGQLFGVPGVLAFAQVPPAIGFGSPVNFVVRNPDFDSLTAGMDAMLARARQIPGLVNVDTDLKVNKPELNVSYKRDQAEDLGVAVADVSSTLQTMLGGQRVGTFTRDSKLYYVVLQLEDSDRETPADMTNLYIRGRDGNEVQLDAVASIEESVGPTSLNHFDRVRSFTLTAGLAPGYTLGEAIDELQALADEVLPRGSSTALSGESRELQETGSALYFAFLLALVVVYMVLAAQFESLVHPFTILLSVPLAVTGALLTLLVTGSSLNLFSQIGMILLVGLATKNSILLVEYANQLRERGMDTIDAVVEAGRIRLRPILMTSVATIVAMVPIALSLGAGSASRRPLGYAIIGGMVFATVLTLFLVPVVYVMFDTVRVRLHKRRESLAPATAEGP
ncbi:MAG: efflux RND transporter permease subunit [Gemmatimonadota bacterium]